MNNGLYAYWETIINLLKAYALIIIILGIFIYILKKYFNKYTRIVLSTVLPLFLFIKLAEDYIRNELAVFDGEIYLILAQYISNDITLLMKFISDLGSGWTLAVITIIIYFILWCKEKRVYGDIILVNLLLCTIFNNIFKIFFHRQRPEILRLVEASGYSFPSGHSMISISFYGLLIYLIYAKINNRILGYSTAIFLSCLIILIGISRIYLGVHYASDVLAGFSVGLAWVTVYIKIIEKYYLKKKMS